MTNELRKKIERWTILAEGLLKTNTRAFIIDTNDSYFFCDIISVSEEKVSFKPFKGNNSGETVVKFWGNIVKFEEYNKK